MVRSVRGNGRGHVKNILTVQPIAFVQVERGVPAIDLRQIKQSNNFLNLYLFPIVPWRPAQQAEIVPNRFRRIALIDVTRDARSCIAFAHLRAVPIQDQRDMGEARQDYPGLRRARRVLPYSSSGPPLGSREIFSFRGRDLPADRLLRSTAGPFPRGTQHRPDRGGRLQRAARRPGRDRRGRLRRRPARRAVHPGRLVAPGRRGAGLLAWSGRPASRPRPHDGR